MATREIIATKIGDDIKVDGVRYMPTGKKVNFNDGSQHDRYVSDEGEAICATWTKFVRIVMIHTSRNHQWERVTVA